MTTPELTALAKKNRLFVASVALTLALGAALYFRSGSIADAKDELERKSAEANRYASNVSYATHLSDQVEALAAANKTVASRLVRATDIGINQQFFYKLESDSGVKLVDLRQSQRTAQAKGGYTPVSFTLSLQGDFMQVTSFLRGLESGAHYCRIMTASLAGGRMGPITMTLNLELLGQP